ncbi:MAG TPA: Rieske (2Fe-2S) protein [Dehalococcoidia bacterium]|nr:Rieske (2Fe-2S) protein [Dehalococcoidia bacterium]
MPGFQRVGAVSEFSDSLVRVFKVEGVDVAVVRHEGQFYAVTGACPHASYLFNYTRIRPEDRIFCSSHGAWFDLKSGKVLGGPTDYDLCVYQVRVEGDDVLVSVDAAGDPQVH